MRERSSVSASRAVRLAYRPFVGYRPPSCEGDSAYPILVSLNPLKCLKIVSKIEVIQQYTLYILNVKSQKLTEVSIIPGNLNFAQPT